jgi:hypothetical protein
MKRIVPLLSLIMLFIACAPQLTKVSGRNPDLFEKESDRLEGRSRGQGGQAAPEMFVREKQTVIKNIDKPDESGSLFNPEDERNYLFTSKGPLNVGRFLKINIVANRGEKKSASAKAPADKDKKQAENVDDIEKELLAGLPDLTPGKKDPPTLQASFKMQIVHRYDNGDVLARMVRRSTNSEVDADAADAAEITAEARIPYDRLASGDDLTTDDLLDVKFRESKEDELAERTSSGWEDEYSLRLSGFNEARSKIAMDLRDQQQKLEEGTKKVQEKIKDFGAERRQLAKDREELARKKQENEAKMKDMETKVEEQQKTIEEQQEQIKDLQPEEKPGDAKEGN